MNVDLACIMHEWGESKSLSSWAATVVNNWLPWFDIDTHAKQLTGFVLYFEVAFFELYSLE